MPWIYLPERKPIQPRKRYRNSDKKNNPNYRYVYNTDTWKKLRIEYLKENPLCEICKMNNRLTLATQVHHIYEISNVTTKKEKEIIGFDWNNLQALCMNCHIEVHKK